MHDFKLRDSVRHKSNEHLSRGKFHPAFLLAAKSERKYFFVENRRKQKLCHVTGQIANFQPTTEQSRRFRQQSGTTVSSSSSIKIHLDLLYMLNVSVFTDNYNEDNIFF